jgi:Cucumopine synthase C-terminal helical bundle domain
MCNKISTTSDGGNAVMSNSTDEAVAVLESELEKIWLTLPDEVKDLGHGDISNGTGARGEYLATIMYAEGDARSLANDMMWGLVRLCEDESCDLYTIKASMEFFHDKANFMEFVALPHIASVIHGFATAVEEAETIAEVHRLASAGLSYANRVHMCLDAIFPWGLTTAFPRKDRPLF